MSGTALPTGSIDDSQRDQCDGGVRGVGHPLFFLEGSEPDFRPATRLCFLLENPPHGGGKSLQSGPPGGGGAQGRPHAPKD